MENSSFSLNKRGDVYVLNMNAGENRFNETFIKHFHEVIDYLEGTEGAAALVTTSSDKKYWCLGLDMACLMKSPKEVIIFLESVLKLLCRFLTLPMPTIAAINGHCTAGGGFLALCHDFRIAADTRALFFMNEIDLGLAFSNGMAQIFKSKIKPELLRDILVLGKRYSLTEATDAGIFDAVVPANNLLDRAISTGQTWAPKAIKRGAMKKIKLQVYCELVSALNEKIDVSLLDMSEKSKL